MTAIVLNQTFAPSSPFAGFEPGHIRSMAGRERAPGAIEQAGLAHLSNREDLFLEGDEASHVYEVMSGVVCLYRIMPDGSNKHVADFEYPNGLAFSPDERVLYVANTRHAAYIHRIELDSAGNMVRRSIFADVSSDEKIGVPDGMKVDVQGNVYRTGPGGTLVYAADGSMSARSRRPKCRPISPLADRT